MKSKILIVDDEALVLTGWEYTLSLAGYSVRTASNGREAVKLAAEERPDVVLTDLFMPEMNGVEVCRKIKSMYPETEVVLVSGHPEEIMKYQGDFVRVGGKDEVLRKPLLRDEIVSAVNKIAGE